MGTDTDGPDDRTAGFRLLYRPTPQLAKSNVEIAFVVEKPRSAYRFDIWTRAGCRTGEDAASLETWQAIFEEHSQPIEVPDWFAGYVRSVWERGGTDEEICLALEDAYETLQEVNAVEPPSESEILGVIGRRTAGGGAVMNSHPPEHAERPYTASAPRDTQDVYAVHASITTGLHYVRALNEPEALGTWLGGENLPGRLIAGRIRQSPFRHLEARIDVGKPEEQIVHVAGERILETVWWGDAP